MPHCSPSSRRRLELELFGDPITRITSTKLGQFLDGILTVLRRVTDVFLMRPFDARNPRCKAADDVPAFIDAERSLCHIRKVAVVFHLQFSTSLDG